MTPLPGDTGLSAALASPAGVVGDGPVDRQPVFRFSAAQLPHDDRYAPAAVEAADTVACA